ncbi:MAG TPA: hypothetical protein VNT04_03650 [Gaiellaceae bacterium]|nr:hypothetical protein [Gaiellaceae bacterium]
MNSQQSEGPAYLPDDFDDAAAKALARLVQQVIAEPSKRKAFRMDPVQAAKDAGLDTDNDKNQKVILTLGDLSSAELRLLSELNASLIAEGLYVETGNPPLMIF